MALSAHIAKWLRNRVRMYRWPGPKHIKGKFYRAATTIDEVMAFFNAIPGSQDEPPGVADAEGRGHIDGHCYVCQRDVRFVVSKLAGEPGVNWRETVVCPDCGLNNRLRSCIHIHESQVQVQDDDDIYVTEAVTPLFDKLSERHVMLTGSEYSESTAPGAEFETPCGPVRNEDVTALTFHDRRFHSVLSFDVLEHVPDYRSALREFHRVLATGGQLILSVPFVFGDKTTIRARLDENGEIEHLNEPIYHGDPVSSAGVLCFYEFGMDLLDEMKNAGFQDSFVICYHSLELGYVRPQVVFVARKRT
jgi:hypothetical protein